MLCSTARSTPNLSASTADDADADPGGKLSQNSKNDTSGLPSVIRVPSLEDDWLTSFFARRPIRNVVSHNASVHDFDIVASCSATV